MQRSSLKWAIHFRPFCSFPLSSLLFLSHIVRRLRPSDALTYFKRRLMIDVRLHAVRVVLYFESLGEK